MLQNYSFSVFSILAICLASITNGAEIGEPCTTDAVCRSGASGQLSRCDTTSRVCVCIANTVVEPGESPGVCRPVATKVGDTCEKNSQCKQNLGALGECEGHGPGYCICNRILGVPSTNNLTCLTKVNFIGDRCTEKVQCTGGTPGEFSDCLGGVCSCTTTSIQLPGQQKCYKLATGPGDMCEHQEQCKLGMPGNHSICNSTSKTCECEGAALNIGGRCLVVVNKLGDPCTDNAQCTSGTPGSLSTCRPLPGNSRERVCQCQATAVENPGMHTCHPKAVNLGDNCTINLQCSANIGDLSTCGADGNCICSTGAIANRDGVAGTKCYPGGFLIGRPCNDSAQCGRVPIENATCSTVCSCTHNTTANTAMDSCLEILDQLDDNCTESQQCQMGVPGPLSTCQEGKCQCQGDAISDEDTCYRKATLVGDGCAKDIQCTANLGPAECLVGIQHCACNGTAVASGDRSKCLLRSFLGEACEEEVQCSHVSHSICNTSQQCQCNAGTGYVTNPHNEKGACMKLAEILGEPCQDHPGQCGVLEGSVCNGETKVCECHEDTPVISPDGKGCYGPVEILNAACNVTTQCQVDNSECLMGPEVDNLCLCKAGFAEGQMTPNVCLELKGQRDDPCAEDIQCRDIGLDSTVKCVNGFCNCPVTNPLSQYYNERCVVPRTLNESCESEDACYLLDKYSTCVSSDMKCACVPGVILFQSKCWGIKKVGDECDNIIECMLPISGPVECHAETGTCRCGAGYRSTNDGTICGNKAGVSAEVSVSILLFVAITAAVINMSQN